MNNEFVTYEHALALKELGFDEPCFGFYDDKKFSDNIILEPVTQKYNEGFNSHKNSSGSLVSAPLYQQAFRWFREKYELHSFIQSDYSWSISGGIWDLYEYKDLRYDWDSQSFNTYESAEQACLDKLIEIIKNK